MHPWSIQKTHVLTPGHSTGTNIKLKCLRSKLKDAPSIQISKRETIIRGQVKYPDAEQARLLLTLNMSHPDHHKTFKSDMFGIFPAQLPVPGTIYPETECQKRIEVAWKSVRNFAGLLNEFNEGIRRRGTFTDDAIRWYVQGYERDYLWEDIQEAHRELGERLVLLNEAMIESAKLRGLDRMEKRGRDRRMP